MMSEARLAQRASVRVQCPSVVVVQSSSRGPRLLPSNGGDKGCSAQRVVSEEDLSAVEVGQVEVAQIEDDLRPRSDPPHAVPAP